MANPARRRTGVSWHVLFLGLLALGAGSCGGTPTASDKVETSKAAAVADPNDRTHTGRAAYYDARAAEYREIARKQRQLAQAYGRRTPRPAEPGKTDWNVVLKAAVESRAADADQIAADIQSLADFHAAQASTEVAR